LVCLWTQIWWDASDFGGLVLSSMWQSEKEEKEKIIGPRTNMTKSQGLMMTQASRI